MNFFGELNTFICIFIYIILFYTDSQHSNGLKVFHSKQAKLA